MFNFNQRGLTVVTSKLFLLVSLSDVEDKYGDFPKSCALVSEVSVVALN